MVPMDQPAAALDMINRFMYNKDLADEDDVVTTNANRQQQEQHTTTAGVRHSLKLPTADGLAIQKAQAVI